MNKLIVGTLAVGVITAGMYFLGKPIVKKRTWSFDNILPRVKEIVAPVAAVIPIHGQNGKRKG